MRNQTLLSIALLLAGPVVAAVALAAPEPPARDARPASSKTSPKGAIRRDSTAALHPLPTPRRTPPQHPRSLAEPQKVLAVSKKTSKISKNKLSQQNQLFVKKQSSKKTTVAKENEVLHSALPGHAKARIALSREPSRARQAVARAPRFPSVALHEANLGEDLSFRPFDDRGRPRAGAAKEFERFMRDHHTGRRHHIDPRLGSWLYEVARHFGHRVEVFSGFRPLEFSARKHSRHITGSAVDFRIPGVRNETLVRYLRHTFHPAGVGYYPSGVHVHLDVDRDHDTYWVDAGDTPSPAPTDKDAGEATVDETVVNPPPPAIHDPGMEIVVPEGPDDDPGFVD